MPGKRPADKATQATETTEKSIAREVARREKISKNVNVLHEQRLTFGQRIADHLAEVAGSWNFILGFLALIAVWIGINAFVLTQGPWDPFPFILLNLVLSLVAGLQAPVIMMSQNRQEAKDRIRADHDYEVNLKAEMEIEQLHEKLDMLREKQWNELVEMQQRQITLLEQQIEAVRGLKKA